MKLSEIVAAFIDAQPAGIVLDEPDITRLLKNSVRFYCTYATLRNSAPGVDERDAVPVIHTAIDATNDISGTQDFDLTPSEWGLIKMLFDLYLEKENATHIEASRGMGADVFGRTVSEVQGSIEALELNFPKMASMELPGTI